LFLRFAEKYRQFCITQTFFLAEEVFQSYWLQRVFHNNPEFVSNFVSMKMLCFELTSCIPVIFKRT
jgi:hypothetical protein